MATAPQRRRFGVDDRIKDVELPGIRPLRSNRDAGDRILAERPSPAIRARVAEYEGPLEQPAERSRTLGTYGTGAHRSSLASTTCLEPSKLTRSYTSRPMP